MIERRKPVGSTPAPGGDSSVEGRPATVSALTAQHGRLDSVGDTVSARAAHARGDGPVVLEVIDAAVHFGGIKAVDGFDVRLNASKIFGIMGPNGSGKSTVLAAITRLVDLTRGQLLFDGKPYQGVQPAHVAKLGISRTFQTVRLLEDLTVQENIQLGAEMPGAGSTGEGSLRSRRADVKSRVDHAIERTGLTNFARLRPGELSYGAQRRVEIARAISMHPLLLLLDEPTAGMNRHERTEIGALLSTLRSEGLTLLFVEHDVQMMVDTCDFIYGMNFGKIIAQGTPEDVVRDPAVQEAYLGKRATRHA